MVDFCGTRVSTTALFVTSRYRPSQNQQKNTRARREIRSKLTIKTPERRQ